MMFVNNVNSVAGLYSSNAVASTRYSNMAAGSKNIQKRDELSLSNAAQSFSSILKELRAQSEVRQSKVDEFQQKIASGNYKVSADAIALSMLTNRF